MMVSLKKWNYLPYIDELKEAGFTEKQARSVVNFQHELNNNMQEDLVAKNDLASALKDVATKNDLHEIKLEVHGLAVDFKWFKFLCCGIFMMMVAALVKLFIH
jgi:hypothetical protein